MNGVDTLQDRTFPKKIEDFGSLLKHLPQFEPDTQHYFSDGMYCRVVARPADTIIVGKVHKKEHFYMVVSGEVRVSTGEGDPVNYVGLSVINSKPGTQRAVYAVTDAVCLTVHKTDKTDLDEIENELVEEDSKAMFDASNKLKGALMVEDKT